MSEIHGISEGSIVEVTNVEAPNAEIGESFGWITEGLKLEVKNIREKVRGSKVMVTFSVVEGQDVPIWQNVTAGTYTNWPNGVTEGCQFNADGFHSNRFDRFFDVQEA